MPDSLSKRLANSGVLNATDTANFPLTPAQDGKIYQQLGNRKENPWNRSPAPTSPNRRENRKAEFN